MRYRLQHGLVEHGDMWLMAFDEAVPDFARAQAIYRGEHTRICRHPDRPGLVSKIAIVQTAPRDWLRKYRNCQARREIESAAILARLGLRAPEMRGHGYTLLPWARYESVLLMDELPASRALRFVFRECRDPGRRRQLLDEVASGLGAVYAAGHHFKDFHFENVLCDASDGLLWIDNDLRYSNRPRRAASRFAVALRRLHATTERFLYSSEWHHFLDRLVEVLVTSTLGRHLAEEVVPRFRIATSARHFEVS